jgi:two-component system chemotaxis sensor kinase CheA
VEHDKTVRINVERLDSLMNLVGELVTERTRMARIAELLRQRYGKGSEIGTLNEVTSQFERIINQLQQDVMQARMLPISRLFQKFPRLVRDVARSENKQVDLIIRGETTELDRSIIEAVGDPLMHLLRNAVDHGLESPEERLAQGKPASGTIWLTAAHVEGNIVITVKDDGRGIDLERVRQAALQRDAISEEEAAQMGRDELLELVFRPNISTAEEITDVSGRGVGLDVVHTNVKQLGGAVALESQPGEGTTFYITLPLTLAILQTMLVTIGDDVYAIPLSSVVESLYLKDVPLSSVKTNPMTRWRDAALPLLYLRQFFNHKRLTAPPSKAKAAIVVVNWRKTQVGLVVDKLMGKQEIVVKSLSPILGNVPGLSSCTILGNGRVALIVDVPGLIGAAMQARKQGETT